MRIILAGFALFAAACSTVEPPWPSPEQVELVTQRKASFPAQSWVSSVDWYTPLETVKGASNVALVTQLADPAVYAEAEALVAKHNSHAFIIWQNGAVRYEKYWPGFNAASRYDTASMHKTVLAVLVGIAKDEGFIESVEDPLKTYLPHLKGKKVGDIPLRSFLQMSSGLQSPPVNDDPSNPYWQLYFGNDLKAALAHWPAPEAYDQEFFYSNGNSQYLNFVLEAATKRRYAEYLSEKLWQPMGAADAAVWLDTEGGSARSSCCLQASARDWLRFGLLLLNKGKVGQRQVVSNDWLNAMTTGAKTNANYGYQIWLGSPHQPQRAYAKTNPLTIPAKAPFARDDVMYLDGFGGQRVYVIPSENLVIVRIGKATFGWDDSELPNLLLSQ